MILAAESLAAAATAAVASVFAGAHVWRLRKEPDVTARLAIAVCLFALTHMYLSTIEWYWGAARMLGMPLWMLHGFAPMAFKVFAMYVLSGGVIWLYSRRYKLAKAVGIPTAFWLASIWLSKSF